MIEVTGCSVEVTGTVIEVKSSSEEEPIILCLRAERISRTGMLV